MRPVNSMIEFKQIIGRGTRLFDGKDYFTIYDFVRAYEHFNDPEWDGEPVEPVPPRPRGGNEGEGPTPTGEEEGDGQPEGGEEEPAARQKVKIKLADGKERTIQHMMATTFWSVDGRPMSAAEFITRLFGDLPELFKDEDELRALWGQHDTRKALLESLSEKGYGDEQLSEIRRMIDAEKSDLFDVLAYIAFALPPSRGKSGRMPIGSRYFPSTIPSFRRFWILSSANTSKKASANWIKPNCLICWSSNTGPSVTRRLSLAAWPRYATPLSGFRGIFMRANQHQCSCKPAIWA
jgi:hypothetical protein